MAPISIKRLVGQQKRRADALRRILFSLLQTPRTSLSTIQVKNALDDLKGYWTDIYNTDLEISVSERDPYIVENFIQEIEISYRNIRDELYSLLAEIENVAQPSTSSVESVATNVANEGRGETSKLPKLSVVKFSGKTEDWDTFSSYFISTIHERENLSDLEKFRYLLASLTDDVKKSIAHLPLKGDNYNIAWKELKDTFDKPRHQLNMLMDKLANLQPIKTLLAEEINSRVKAMNLTFLAMKKITKSDTDLLEAMMCHRLLQILDSETHRLWEEHLAFRDNSLDENNFGSRNSLDKSTVFPKMADLVRWLNCRRDGLNSVKATRKFEKEPKKVFQKEKFVKAYHAENKPHPYNLERKCPLCSQKHFVSSCPDFGKKSLKERRDDVRRLRLCFNCLGHHRMQFYQGSQISFITEALAQTLCLTRSRVHVSLSGIGALKAGTVRSKSTIVLRSFQDSEFSLEIEVLILPKLTGASEYSVLIKEGLYRWPETDLIAQDTVFGWIISGVPPFNSARRAENLIEDSAISMVCAAEEELRNSLQRLWESEEFKENSHLLNPEEEKSLRRRLSRDAKLNFKYQEFLKEYEELKHMERVPHDEIKSTRVWYLPHHAVITEVPRWKIRVVSDASRQTAHQQSLNKALIIGPPLQNNLTLVLLNWRRFRFVFTADIIKMFRQIKIHQNDRDFLRILWSPNESEASMEYRHTMVTYGTACAPYLAIKTLQQLVIDEGHRFPQGAQCLRSQTYVDDIFGGADCLYEAQRERKELISLLKTAGIELDKWAANHNSLLPENLKRQEISNTEIPKETFETVKTLGIQWDPFLDAFGFSVKTQGISINIFTKRNILSCLSKLYDPLGWISPVIIAGKIFIQDLWIAGVGWDEKLDFNKQQFWKGFQNSLQDLNNLKINRWFESSPKSKMELHGFCDASTRAYAAAIYIRTVSEEGKINVSLVASKAKVSPVKTVSIPKLELCGAALLVRLFNHVRKLNFLKDLDVIAWSDSQVTLAWIKKHPSQWKTFIANRVSFIQTQLPEASWKYIPTKQNPADMASRGLSASELRDSNEGQVLRDADSQILSSFAIAMEQGQEEDEIITRFSSLLRATRVIAYCFRFFDKCHRNKRKNFPNFLSVSELVRSRKALIKCTQRSVFFQDIETLRVKNNVSKRSQLKKLNPYLDKEGILRVKGRLRHSVLQFNTKFPPILPKHSNLSSMYVYFAHQECWHGGVTLTLSTLRTHVWILGASSLVKKILRNCTKCKRFQTTSLTQQMGDLPFHRVNFERPFSISGVDYAGPLQIRRNPGRGHSANKGYIALFICLATKAVHLEAVGDLSTEAFLGAYRRFAGRRGVCRILYSDNGTNFKGADVELRKMFEESSEFFGNTAEKLASQGTEWKFIPPRTPHFGRIWEAGIKSMKRHLIKVMGDHKLTFEELSTVLVQIEACMNSRPLCPLSNDPEDLDVLTPAHFLTGEVSTLIPEAELIDIPENRLNRYQLLQKIRSHYWKRWSQEYLTNLQERTKWFRESENLREGQLVILREEGLSPAKWSMGRILKIYPGADGLVRVVTLKTSTTVLKRSITRIIPILQEEEKDKEERSSNEQRKDK
ncbi:uncharacterized protein [Cardiocondyla obscurior]|uniref:uncharacterized protein n=1 Tax=Cardiocondyla obscurior TaxID=286306 RepID=UPI00396561F2